MRTRLSSEGANSSTLALNVLKSWRAIEVGENVDDNRRFQAGRSCFGATPTNRARAPPVSRRSLLFAAQGARGVNASGTSRGDVAGEECNRRHQRPTECKCRYIQRADAEQHT